MSNSTPAHMQDKGLVFVLGHPRPAVEPLGAPYTLKHPDGSPMLAISTKDTFADCRSRWEEEQAAKAAAEAATDVLPAVEGLPLSAGDTIPLGPDVPLAKPTKSKAGA